MKKILILDNIRSAHNVGAIFRTADGAGVERVYLIGYTPAPVDRFGRVQPEIAKTSLGASGSVPWEAVPDAAVPDLIVDLKREGYSIVAVEQTPQAMSLRDFVVPEHVAYILGNEVEGVSEALLTLVDQMVEIPMHGLKESLNVSTCAGIVLYKE